MAKDLTPKEFKCTNSFACPGVFELEDGRLLIVGEDGAAHAYLAGKIINAGEEAVVISPDYFENVLCQASDVQTGEGSAPSAFQLSVGEDANCEVTIDYTNWRGERRLRRIIPEKVRFGVSGWHVEPQWLLQAIDTESGDGREFALKDIHSWGVDEDCKPDERTAEEQFECQADGSAKGEVPSLRSSGERSAEAEKIAKAIVEIEFAGNDLHDNANDVWRALREADLTADRDAEHYDCALCGATMFPCLDYTHLPTCPYEVISQQIDVFADAVRAAYSKIAQRQIEEARSADTATATGDTASLTPISTPQEAPAGPGDDNG